MLLRLVVVALALLPCANAGAVTLDEILARHLAARGGADKLAALHTLELSGRMSFTSPYGDFHIELTWRNAQKRPAMLRNEASLQGLSAVQAYDGREAWQVQPFQGRRDPERLSADEAKSLALAADLDGPLVGWREKGSKLEYLGVEDVDGTAAHKIKVTRKNGDVQLAWVDPDHFLLIRVQSRLFIRGAEKLEETDYGNYEQVAGVWVPFSVDTGDKPGGPKTQKVTVERAWANIALDDALFHFPAGKIPPLPEAPAELPRGAVSVVAGSSTPPPAPAAAALRVDAGVVSGLGARNIGSATMSGRIAAVAAYNDAGRTVIFIGAASGGVWKSIDGGTTFKPVFDEMPVQSIGSIAVDPRNPKNVWVGTGESWTRNSVSFGDGMYKSTDGGETWTHVGLGGTERITKIVVNPKNGDVVYACAPGRLWSDSADRGLYKTTDGGKTWTLALKSSSPSTGCSGVSLDPANPDVVLAGLWDFRRKGWTFRSGGDGPEAVSGSGLYRSQNGGKSWTELTPKNAKGLPEQPYGRIEVVHAPSNGKIVYALIEGRDTALFRSSDGGQTWDRRDKSQMMVWRPFYFARLVVDPKNPERVFKTDLNLIVSDDGGKSFSNTSGGSHGDWHDLWVDPQDTKHIVGGDDGGMWTSFDGGNRWFKNDNLPISQFYHVSVDSRDPYHVYGGLQDNSSWVGPSAYPGGIENARWENLYNGDGFWVWTDPTNEDAVYAEWQGGNIGRVDRVTRALRDIQPKAGYHEKLRFNWNAPIALSPNDKGTIYIGAQFLFRSRDKGQSWDRISPDLTTNDPEKQKQEESGGITVDNSSAEMHTTIYSISESPKAPGLIWVGTDDGNVQLTRDGGKTWTNVVKNVSGLPPASWVSWVEASRFDPATAYAAFDRHTFGDFAPYVYRTSDYGQSWTRVAGPEQGLQGWAHVVKEDPIEGRILWVGTELGLWVSIDAGKTWAAFKGGKLPAVAVRDLAFSVRDNDLAIATHGRGIWIIDDVTPLRALSAEVAARDVAFLPGRPVQQRMNGVGGWMQGDAKYTGETAPSGAMITYYQATRHLYGPIQLEILGADGKVLDTVNASKRRGINRAAWTMRLPPPRVPRAAQIAFSSTEGPRVLPGTYRARLTKGKEVVEMPLEIRLDRRAPYDAADRKAQFDAVVRVRNLFGRMSSDVDRIEVARGTALARAEALGAKTDLGAKLAAFAAKLDEQRKKIVATKEGGAITGEERLREHADSLYGALNGYEGRPGAYHLERIAVLERELADVENDADPLLKQVPALNQELEKAGQKPIPTEPPQHTQAEPRSSDLQRAFGHFLGLPMAAPDRLERD